MQSGTCSLVNIAKLYNKVALRALKFFTMIDNVVDKVYVFVRTRKVIYF